MADNHNRVMMIALDTAEKRLIEQGMEDGTLPNLARLRERGAFGPLASTVEWLTGTPWPTFYTSTLPAEHGYYCFVQWRPDQMRHERPNHDWLPLTPFYRRLHEQDCKAIAVDVPLVYSPQPGDGGIEVASWGTHDALWDFRTNPPELIDWVKKNFGGQQIGDEPTGLQDPRELIRTRDQLIETTRRQGDLCLALMEKYPDWNFFIMAFGSTHRAGHKLWDITGCSREPTEEEAREIRGALMEVYAEADRQVGRMAEAAGDDATVITGALHGVTDTQSRFDILPEMVDRVLHDKKLEEGEGESEKKPSLLGRLRNMLPLEFRTAVKKRLPKAIQDKMTLFWHGYQHDWSTTKAFCTMGDLEAYVQINLKGREPQGIVEPGEEYEALMQKFIDGLKTFVDADTGEPVIHSFGRGTELWADEVPPERRKGNLPDLVVRWARSPAVKHRKIVSERYGTIPWPTPGRSPDGRSGHHIPTGWLVAVGPHIEPGTRIENARGLDLAPTIHKLLGVNIPEGMRGGTIDALYTGQTAASKG